MNAPASTPRDLPGHLTQSSRQLAASQDTVVPAYSARPMDCPSEAQNQGQPLSTALGPGKNLPRAKMSGIKAARGKSISHVSGSPPKKKMLVDAAKTSLHRTGNRSVSTLTPAQLQRKRENDRMYQKTARQRIQDRINFLVEEVRILKIRHSHDTEIIRKLRQGNQVLEKEVQGQERLRINDSETICQLCLKNQAIEAESASLFSGFGTIWTGATIGTVSPADTSDAEAGLWPIVVRPLQSYGGELSGATV
ncbi:hypothetical protein Purlil1_13007 [Purpureocillium lilacinum]|uniref:BZIP transcription factor domain-containing protein n=1 Tax=Purpureocillium lilacinum TaxID=33203 RepID=A0ABR0BFB2_PURLI|nr:hypothetical protein Purlil1_13007 [Purpureocillium lilacinum]